MDLTPYQHVETLAVAASPEDVYDLVADITRMGEWSPVCTAGEWVDDARASFLGTNAMGDFTWQTTCRIDVAERGKEFTFVNRGQSGDEELVRWSYTFVPVPGGTELTESWQVLPEYEPSMARLMPDMNLKDYLDGVKPATQAGMAETLANVKAAAEG
jgi:ribosome-associated toxin RatA of RatAB toxin-antitoxin module